jgi:hypothetical protein
MANMLIAKEYTYQLLQHQLLGRHLGPPSGFQGETLADRTLEYCTAGLQVSVFLRSHTCEDRPMSDPPAPKLWYKIA